jgi:predicted ATPase
VGTKDSPGSISFFEAELNYLDSALNADLATQHLLRKRLVRQIFSEKQEIQVIYNKIKISVGNVLREHSREQNISIETAFKIDRAFFNRVFDYINRYGDFYGSGDEKLKDMVANYNFDDAEQIVAFIDDFSKLTVHYKEGRKTDFYNYLTSLDYLEPEYELRLNGKGLNQLSPGEKGGLLLIFYLVLDKETKPLIIDQPEDNLDNQSVAEILVPYIKSAKSKRQIIMVTHNPNLAIVADAEQIVYMNIDKEDKYKVSTVTGAIENPNINNHIVDILEGRMKAFNNRRLKYRRGVGRK